MKKAISSLLLSAMMLASAQPLVTQAAAPKTELSTRTEYLTVPENVEDSNGNIQVIPAGIIKVSFVISNNPGYGLCGIAIPFDPAKFHVIMDEGLNEPLRIYGPASVGLSPYFTVNYDVEDKYLNSNNKKKGNVAVGVYSAHTNNKKNGVIYGNIPHTGLVSSSATAMEYFDRREIAPPEKYSWDETDAPISLSDFLDEYRKSPVD